MTYAIGDCRVTLAAQPECSMQMCVTSPPYWGLRDYGHADQLGLEPTPAEYVANMVEVFREVRRVLRDDGVLWLNLGDSYAGAASGSDGVTGSTLDGGKAHQVATRITRDPKSGIERNDAAPHRVSSGLAAKNLVGIPWRVAFALQADGWWLRQDIIWHKPNPMPESVTDRCTKAHEYVFLLSKSERYYFDAKAIAEAAVCAGGYAGYAERAESMGRAPSGNEKPGVVAINADTRNARSVWTIATQPYSGAHFATMPPALVERCILAGSRIGDTVLDPFLGSGTTGMVAERNGRKWFGCELNPAYEPLIKQRTAQRGLFTGDAA